MEVNSTPPPSSNANDDSPNDMMKFVVACFAELLRTKGSEMPLDEFCSAYAAPMFQVMKMASEMNEVKDE